MNIKQSFTAALKKIRKAKGITQEDFSNVSSRTYVSTLERGLYSPIIEKADALAGAMGIHPLTLLSLAYLIKSESNDATILLSQINDELSKLNSLLKTI